MLFIFSIIGGSIINWIIFSAPLIICLPFYFKYLTLFVCLLGGLIGYIISYVYIYYYNFFLYSYYYIYFLGSMWFTPVISTLGILKYPLNKGLLVVKGADFGWREIIGAQIIYYSIKSLSMYKYMLYSNNLKIYLIRFFIWIILLFIFMYL